MHTITQKAGAQQSSITNSALQQSENKCADFADKKADTSTSRPGFDFGSLAIHPRAMAAPLAKASAQSDNQSNSALYRDAAGPEPEKVPDIVHDVVRREGQPMPAGLRQDMEQLLGHNFADVRVHTDDRAATSAAAVSANAYTVGRHIVFAPGRFDPGSAPGRQLLAHELTHAAGHPSYKPTPSGELRVSRPNEPAEQHAAAVSTGAASLANSPSAAPALFRTPAAPVAITGVNVNHDRITVPPAAGLSFTAAKSPANASGVTFAILGDNATIDPGTTINGSGVISVAATQTGGSAHIDAIQTIPGANGATNTSTATALFNFSEVPTGIGSTSSSTTGTPGFYGGDFVHTFSAAGGASALDRSHVNEQFAGASGTTLNITGTLGSFAININNPDAASSGWDLDSSGTMAGPDHVTWSNTVDARPFVANASQPTPAQTLPQELTATQNFRNLSFPGNTYGAAAVASTTHRRAIEDRNNLLKAVTSANATGINEEVVENYAGPTVFRRCVATPNSIPVSAPTPPGATATPATTATITVAAEGQTATPVFSIVSPDLGCLISATGVLTPGTTPGTVTIRAGDSVNYDEVVVTLTPPAPVVTPAPAPTPAPTPVPTP